MARKRLSRGFTLVELMIVVAIIGVLAALAIYGVRKYLAAAKSAEARLGLGNIGRAAQAAYARETAPAQSVGPGLSSLQATQALCNGVDAPVPSTSAAIKGRKYTADSTQGKDYATGTATDGWICLRYEMTSPQYYQYNYTGGDKPGMSIAGQSAGASPPIAMGDPTHFAAEASGDLNGDGVMSLFSLAGQIDVTTKQLSLATQIYENNPDD